MANYFLAPAVNFLTKTLSGSLTDVAGTITLSNTTNMLAPGYIVINRVNSSGTATPDNREVVYYTGIAGSDLTGCTRGADGSTARAHADNSIVETMLTAGAWNSLTTITSTAIDSNGLIRAIASPISIARVESPFIKSTQVLSSTITITTHLNVSGASIVGSFPASDPLTVRNVSVTSIASIARVETPLLAGWDSWTIISDTWAYASASTFTIAGVDRTGVYTKGTRLRFKQGGAYKYAVVVASAFSTNTTVTIAVNTDHTIANAGITDNYISYGASPAGYPTTFAYTATWSCSGSMTIGAGTVNFTRFSILGNKCSLSLSYSAFTLGGTQSTDIYATLPVNSSRSVSAFQNDINATYMVDGGTSKVGSFGIADGDATKARFRITNEGNWTLGSTNSYVAGQLTYEY